VFFCCLLFMMHLLLKNSPKVKILVTCPTTFRSGSFLLNIPNRISINRLTPCSPKVLLYLYSYFFSLSPCHQFHIIQHVLLDGNHLTFFLISIWIYSKFICFIHFYSIVLLPIFCNIECNSSRHLI